MSTRTRFPTALFAFALVLGSGLLLAPRTASAQFDLEVIYSEIASSPTSDVPGALELAGQLARLPDLTLRYSRTLLTQRLKRLLDEGIGHGLALEGLAALELIVPRAESAGGAQ